ncbi:MAG TPA: T9SS type A sorting domain-containing protein [Bacteroidia bacterium]
MKANIFRTFFALLFSFFLNELSAQTIYPPNHSFEADTILPWEIKGRYDLPTSVNMNFPTDGKYFIELTSSKIRNLYTLSTLKIKFSVNDRVRYLNFASMFWSTKNENKFRVKYQLTKYNPYYKRSYLICNMDTMMDTICNIRDYREDWFYHKVDLKPYYLSNQIPDSCLIEISCDFIHLSTADFIQYLDLDNFVLTGNVDAQVSVEDQSKSNCDIRVYPNPSNGLLNVDLSAVPDVVKLEVLSADGQIVVFLDDPEALIQLDLSACARGCYLLKIASADGNIQYKKLLLE